MLPARLPMLCLLLLALSCVTIEAFASSAPSVQPRLWPQPLSSSMPIPVLHIGRPSGLTLRYSIDGAPVAAHSPIWPGMVLVTDVTTVRVRFFSGEEAVGPELSHHYQVQCVFTTARPTFEVPAGSYDGPVMVSVQSETPAAVVRVARGDPPGPEQVVNTELLIDQDEVLRARASGGHAMVRVLWWRLQMPMLFPSGVARADYDVTPAPPEPVFDPAPGMYHDTLNVQVSGGDQVEWRYSLDGSELTAEAAIVGSDGILVDRSVDLAVQPWRDGLSLGPVTQVSYEMQVAAPQFSPEPGSVGVGAVRVEALGETSQAQWHYRLDGGDPGPGDPSLPAEFEQGVSLRVVGVREGFAPSPVVAADFAVRLPEVRMVESEVTVDEDVGMIGIGVSLDAPSLRPVRVRIQIRALDPGFRIGPSGDIFLPEGNDILIPVGQTKAVMPVLVIDDLIEEGDERARMDLHVLEGAVLGQPTQTLFTIIDNDIAPRVIEATGEEGGTLVTLWFDLPLDQHSAESIDNYLVGIRDDRGIGVFAMPLHAMLLADGKTVVLTLPGDLAVSFGDTRAIVTAHVKGIDGVAAKVTEIMVTPSGQQADG